MAYLFGEYRLDVARRELRRGDDLVALEPQVFELLAYLVRHRDRVVGKNDLLEAVWGGRIVSDSALTTRINAARRALGDSGDRQQLIRTLQRKGFRFVAEVHESGVHEPFPRRHPASPERPAIAVLPFIDLSGDAGQAHLGDGAAEHIAAALGRIRWLSVLPPSCIPAGPSSAIDVRQVGRELGARYVLQGSARRSGKRLRVTARLVETESRAQLWADWCDGTLDGVFELQDALAAKVASSIEPAIETAEARATMVQAEEQLSPWDLYFRALPGCYRYDSGPLLQARDLLDQAIARDPGFAPALAAAAGCRHFLGATGWADDPQTNRVEAIALAHQALQADGDDPGVLTEAARVLGYFTEDIDSAVALVNRALALNPSHARGWYWNGWLHLFGGDPDRAIDHFQTAQRLVPLNRPYMTGIGVAHFFSGRYREAADVLATASHQLPGWPTTQRFLAAAYVHLGWSERAQQTICRLRTIGPALAVGTSAFRKHEHSALYTESLRAATAV